MNLPPRFSSSIRRGALMGAALMLMLVSGLFLAGWVTMMSTRAMQVSYLEDAVQRRIALENSRYLSWQTTMDHAFDPDTNLEAKTALLLGGKLGGLSTDNGWNDLNIYQVQNSSQTSPTDFPYNYSGLRPGDSYLALEKFLRPESLEDLDGYTAHLFLKSHCPVLNGDLFVVYHKPSNFSGELNIQKDAAPFQVYGRTVIRHPPSLFVLTTSKVNLPFQSKSLYIQSYDPGARYPIVGQGLNGKVLLPSNLSVVPSSNGPLTGDKEHPFDGYLDVIKNVDNPDNSLWHLAETGQYEDIDVFTKTKTTSDPWYMVQYSEDQKPRILPPGYPRGYDNVFKTLYINLADTRLKHLRIVNNGTVVDQIVFVGQTNSADFEAAGALSPVIVTLINGQSKWTKNLAFENENNRRVIIGVKDEFTLSSVIRVQPRQIDLKWAGNPILGRELRWRMTLINEGHAAFLKLPDNSATDVRWIGGVMTNWSFWRDTDSGPRAERLIFQSDDAAPTLPIVGVPYASLLPRDAWLETYFLPDRPPTE